MQADYSIFRRLWRIIYPPFLLIAIQLVGTIIVAFLIALFYGLKEIINGSSASLIAAIDGEVLSVISNNFMIIQIVSQLACLAVFLPMWLRTRKEIETSRNSNPVVITLVIAGFFAAFNVVQMFIFTFTDLFRFFPSYDEVTQVITNESIITQLLAVGIAAPIIEELVFRGIVINRMSWMPVWLTVLIQGVLFAAVHMNLFQALYAFFAGILLGLVYIKFRSLIIVIIGHMAYNIISVITLHS